MSAAALALLAALAAQPRTADLPVGTPDLRVGTADLRVGKQPGSALECAAAAVAQRALAVAPPATSVIAIQVDAPNAPELGRAAQTALAAAVGGAGRAALALAGPADQAEAQARAGRADLLIRVTARLEGSELVLAGDAVPTWVNFWAGRDPLRAPGGGALAAKIGADEEARALARLAAQPTAGQGAPAALRFAVQAHWFVPERVVALAAGELDGAPRDELVSLSELGVTVMRADGVILAQRDLRTLPAAARPPRAAAGSVALAVAPGPPRVAAFNFAFAHGEQLDAPQLAPAGALESVPLGHGLVGTPSPGKNVLSPAVQLPSSASRGKSATLPFAPLAVVPTRRGPEAAWLAIGPDGEAALIDAALSVRALPVPPIGAGAVLVDLDRDGQLELVASSFSLGPDRLRVYRLDAKATVLFESPELSGQILSACAADLDGDGVDEAIFGEALPSGGTFIHSLGVQR